MPKIIFTGGGSAGHVTPNIALIKQLQLDDWDIHYIGSKQGIEKTLVAPLGIPYHSISTGKLRRYFSWQNFIDPFKLIAGLIKSTWLCFRLKPQVVFSKGGFVSVPVVIAAWLNRIPVILHESDLTPGLANRLCIPFAKKICLSFKETQPYIKAKNKIIVTGTPVREMLFHGDKNKGLTFAQLTTDKPIILVITGSLGSTIINEATRAALPKLLEKFAVIHICGKGNIIDFPKEKAYRQYEYLNDELPNVYACTDMVVSRAGANSIYELLSLRKPNLLIPLSKKSSRGDQIINAHHFEALGFCQVLDEEDLSAEHLVSNIEKLYQNIDQVSLALKTFEIKPSVKHIIKTIRSLHSG